MFRRLPRGLFWIALSLSLSAVLLSWLAPPLSEESTPKAEPKSALKPEPSPLSTAPPEALVQERKAPDAPSPKSAIVPEPIPPNPPESRFVPRPPEPQAAEERAMDAPSMVEDLDAGYEGPGGLLEEVAPLEAVEESMDAGDLPLERQD